MRTLKILLTVSGFATYFIGMVVLSAVSTSLVHSAFFPRAVPIVLTAN